MTKKSFVKLLPMFLAVIFSAIMLAATTAAWLAMNKEVDSNGLEMEIGVPASLIISDSAEGIQQAVLTDVNESGDPFSVTFTGGASTYIPATYDVANSSGLKCLENSLGISPATGLITSGGSYHFTEATKGSNYIDYVVYVAAHSQEITGTKLKIKINSATKTTGSGAVAVTSGSLMATSIDVYQITGVSTITGSSGVVDANSTYKGTLNVADMVAGSGDHEEIYVVGGADSTGTIPLNTSGYLTFLLRCYFDGALESSVGQAYIYSNLLDTSAVSISVKFWVVE